MADQLYLSLWLDNPHPLTLLASYEKLLAVFPHSLLSQNEANFRIHAVAFSEPALLESTIPPPVDVAAVLRLARDFQNPDNCYELSTTWDLWHYEADWKVAPAGVRLTCFGPDFESDLEEQFRIDFGLEDQFLPSEDAPGGITMVRSNIASLLKLVKDVDDRLKPERKLLWSESGGNFAERLEGALRSLAPG